MIILSGIIKGNDTEINVFIKNRKALNGYSMKNF